MTRRRKGPWRDTWGHFVARALNRRRCPHPSCKARGMTDGQLLDHLRDVHDWDTPAIKAYVRELDRRDEHQHRKREHTERRKDAARRLADEHEIALEAAYLQAEHQTRGHMLSPAGKAAGINPRSLWTGPEARARKYASEELRAYFDQHGRLTKTEFARRNRDDRQRAQEHDEDMRRITGDKLYGIY